MDLKTDILNQMSKFDDVSKISIESVDEFKNVLDLFLLRAKSNHQVNQVLNAVSADLDGILKSDDGIRDDLKIKSVVRLANFVINRLS
ncbi:hypothetical protein HO918_01150 [Streptococcus suis]|uniref:hypothetical protein n=1 Tax=Streptococcus suis TaxID=1307 RepID=UPI0005CD0A98|nr:hypothetical protein [Streptococcus suis]NQH08241.1 hypothetical protein [Streptococcus suis]NQP41582.1 hypothetical protein [Streptococcus suis]CYV35753.1 Uncharacterised protein [Streptococcus suis]HEL2084726.1 hypothetical protein [Streptococcus suis]HEL2103471.1 hypothetical protein [Streptococcus suis]